MGTEFTDDGVFLISSQKCMYLSSQSQASICLVTKLPEEWATEKPIFNRDIINITIYGTKHIIEASSRSNYDWVWMHEDK